jgi:predicted RNase H-like HicB family nuclease
MEQSLIGKVLSDCAITPTMAAWICFVVWVDEIKGCLHAGYAAAEHLDRAYDLVDLRLGLVTHGLRSL